MRIDAYLNPPVMWNDNDSTKMSEEETMYDGMVDLNRFLIYSFCNEIRLFRNGLFVGL